jgi:hypothetical protein
VIFVLPETLAKLARYHKDRNETREWAQRWPAVAGAEVAGAEVAGLANAESNEYEL